MFKEQECNHREDIQAKFKMKMQQQPAGKSKSQFESKLFDIGDYLEAAQKE